MARSRFNFVFAITVLALPATLILAPTAAHAHEAHRQNQTTEEAVQQAQATSEGRQAHGESVTIGFDAVDFLGRLHPAAVHFPIALLLFAAFLELTMMVRPQLRLERTVGLLVWAGAISGVLAVLLGWYAGGFRLTDRSDLLFVHRWNGTAIVVAALFAALGHSRGWNRIVFRLLVFSVAIALIIQGYLGGELAFGPDHLNLKPKGGS